MPGEEPRLNLDPRSDLWDGALRAAFARSPAAAIASLPPADTAAPRYEITGEIARGGVGVVHRGRDHELRRDVAIKVLAEQHLPNAGMVARFLDEARIAGQLQHPGVVPVYGLGRQDDARPFFVMKLVEGRTLADLLRERTSPSTDLDQWLRTLEQVCHTIAYAHARGVVHRDLKPSNIMVGAFGEVQVMDWGFAKVLTGPSAQAPGSDSWLPDPDQDPMRSQAGTVMGTPAYMPPEQARGEIASLTERTDVFALGAILCEVLTGEPPYSGSQAERLIKAQSAELEPAFARLAACGADPDLIQLARRCLASDQKSRPSDAGELAATLGGHLASAQARARAAELEAAQARAKAQSERRARRLSMWLAAAIITAMALTGAGYAWVEHDRTRRTNALTGDVRKAMQHALALRADASRADALADNQWQEALLAAQAAAGLARSGTVVAGVLEAVLDLERDIAEQARRACEAAVLRERDGQLSERLSAIIASWETTAFAEVDRDFDRAFIDYGIDFDAMTEPEIIARIMSRPPAVAEDLAKGLFAWVRVRGKLNRESQRPDRASLAKAMRVIQICDPDPLRIKIREFVTSEDVVELRAFASMPEMNQCDERTLVFGEWLLQIEPAPTAEAVRHFQAAVALGPQVGAAWLGLGRALRRTGDGEAALTALREAARLLPDHAACWLELGGTLADVSHLEEALGHLERAAAMTPDHARAWIALGACRERLGDFDGARNVFDLAIECEPRAAEALARRGDLMGRLGDYDAACADLASAVEASVGRPLSLARFAAWLVQYGASDQMFDRLHGLASPPTAPAAIVELCGIIALERGRFSEALSFLRRAATDPSCAEAMRWVEECERMIGLQHATEPDLATAPAAHLAAWARFYLRAGQSLRASRLWQAVMTARADVPSETPGQSVAYLAARATARAARDASDPAQRPALRSRAVTWLSAELDRPPVIGPAAAQRREELRRWLRDADLRSLWASADEAVTQSTQGDDAGLAERARVLRARIDEALIEP